MNQAHLHLLVNHLPIIFPLVGLFVLITGLVFKSEAVKRTAFGIFIFAAIATMAAMATGEGAEEIAEKIQGVDEKIIKIHEEAAEVFAVLSYLMGAFSILALWANIKERTFAPILSYLLIVFASILMFFAANTGKSGGEIRHTEIRSDASISTIDNTNNQENSAGEKDDDD